MKSNSILDSERDIFFMRLALEQATLAAQIGEVPVGAVIVHNNSVIAAAHNRREIDKNALAHAEILAIHSACKVLGGWRLHQCDIYVTLEPCPMCTGAILNARIRRVIFGANDPKAGCLGSVINLIDVPFNHRPDVSDGILLSECSKQLKSFFIELRKNNG